MKLSEKIVYCRKRAGLSQEALAERLGVSRQAVSKWETGEALPETNKLAALAAELGVSVDWLLSEDGPAEPRPQSGDWTEGLPKLLKRAARRWGWLAGIYYALLGLFMSGMGAFLLSLTLRLRQDVRAPFEEIGLGHLFDQPGTMYYDLAHDKTYILCIVLIVLGAAISIAGAAAAVLLRRRSRGKAVSPG